MTCRIVPVLYVRAVMGKFQTAVSKAQAAPDLPIPARLRYITCTKKTNRCPDAPTATATPTATDIAEDLGEFNLSSVPNHDLLDFTHAVIQLDHILNIHM